MKKQIMAVDTYMPIQKSSFQIVEQVLSFLLRLRSVPQVALTIGWEHIASIMQISMIKYNWFSTLTHGMEIAPLENGITNSDLAILN